MQCRYNLTAISRNACKRHVLLASSHVPHPNHRLHNLTSIPQRRRGEQSRISVPPTSLRRGAGTYQRKKDVTHVPDTIYALSTGAGRAAIAVIRISGPACLDIYGGLCPDRPFPIPRKATLRKLFHPVERDGSENGLGVISSSLQQQTSRILDHGALVLYFPAPHTVTGENVLELHVHGGPAIVRSVLEAIPQCTGTRPRRRSGEYSHIRPAEPGEFTKRAFYNGRLDLTEAEALGDALAAETEQQRRLAVQAGGDGLAKRYEEWRMMLLYARGELEALIDFSEDQHFDESPREFMRSVTDQVRTLKRQIEIHVRNAARGELLRNGIDIALLGAPNAGKSSLLNRIVGREAAIVSAEAGTTRDIVDVSVDIGGWLCRLGDMAGLRGPKFFHQTDSPETNLITEQYPRTGEQIGAIEKEGIRRARERALQSDIVIVLLAAQPRQHSGAIQLAINSEVFDATQECISAGKTIVVVVNKVDLLHTELSENTFEQIKHRVCKVLPAVTRENVFAISCRDASSADLQAPSNTASTIDPGRIQIFLSGLTRIMAAMTAAVVSVPPAVSGTSAQNYGGMSPAEGQAYWTQSLSITDRQSNYLKSCLNHLDDFIAMSEPLPSVDSPSGINHGEPNVYKTPYMDTNNASNEYYHIDGHDDIVGEIDETLKRPGHVSNPSPPSAASLQHNSPTKSDPTFTSSASTQHLKAIDQFNSMASPFPIINTEEIDIVQAAEHLRYAADTLSRITGRGEGAGDVEDVLGVVFEK